MLPCMAMLPGMPRPGQDLKNENNPSSDMMQSIYLLRNVMLGVMACDFLVFVASRGSSTGSSSRSLPVFFICQF